MLAKLTPRGNVRWLMIWLVFVVSAVSYLDRTNISIAAPALRLAMGISDIQFGTIFSAFVVGYAVTQPIAGRLADRFGALSRHRPGDRLVERADRGDRHDLADLRGAFAVMVAVRLLLGIGEAVIYPASNRLVANWVPSAERGLATGLIFAGVGFGAGIAPPLITFIMQTHDWRWAFWVSALIGLAVGGIWLLLAREKPQSHPMIKAEELAYIQADHGLTTTAASPKKLLSWREILLSRTVALLSLSYFCFGYVGYIFFTWFFTYLSSVRGLDLKSSGVYGMLPFMAMAVAAPLRATSPIGWPRALGLARGAACPPPSAWRWPRSSSPSRCRWMTRRWPASSWPSARARSIWPRAPSGRSAPISGSLRPARSRGS